VNLARKDTVLLAPNAEVKVYMRFRDFMGKYVMHCHNVVHEDHAMMIRFDVVP
jgi:FtsP/CotA-like multicopper oxidase with cupredoxin domain